MPGRITFELSQVLVISREGTRATVLVQIVGDTVCEPDETFTVQLSKPEGATLEGPGEQTVTILNDDTVGAIVLSPSPLVTAENGPSVPLKVRLTCPPAAPITVSLSASPPLATIAPAAVRFVPARWNVPATVQVTGLDDPACQAATAFYTITGVERERQSCL